MTTTSTAVPKSGGGTRVRVQRFGTFLSGMVMPNIPAFIAWGIITAFFIQTGWTPNGLLGGFGTTNGVANTGLVGPIITWLIPLLIAAQGGRMVYGIRGAVVGTVMTMGVIVGSLGTTMILGAMICGPLGGYLIKQIDRIWENKIK
ncbi:MAG: mannitol system or component, partial [Microbacteriaceae bacterium]|nr:mannitol system or component [Microbacteriaceae bacterium]